MCYLHPSCTGLHRWELYTGSFPDQFWWGPQLTKLQRRQKQGKFPGTRRLYGRILVQSQETWALEDGLNTWLQDIKPRGVCQTHPMYFQQLFLYTPSFYRWQFFSHQCGSPRDLFSNLLSRSRSARRSLLIFMMKKYRSPLPKIKLKRKSGAENFSWYPSNGMDERPWQALVRCIHPRITVEGVVPATLNTDIINPVAKILLKLLVHLTSSPQIIQRLICEYIDEIVLLPLNDFGFCPMYSSMEAYMSPGSTWLCAGFRPSKAFTGVSRYHEGLRQS